MERDETSVLSSQPTTFQKAIPIWIWSQIIGNFILTELPINVSFISVISLMLILKFQQCV